MGDLMKRIWTNGCFDLLHAGHVTFLQHAASLGTLTVFLNSDASISALKGAHRPITPLVYRRKMLEALRCVTHVHVFDGPTPVELWATLGAVPDMYVKDSECDIVHSAEGQWMLERGVAITALPRLPGISTTIIEQRIRAGVPSSVS